jgi:hypothetical protein
MEDSNWYPHSHQSLSPPSEPCARVRYLMTSNVYILKTSVRKLKRQRGIYTQLCYFSFIFSNLFLFLTRSLSSLSVIFVAGEGRYGGATVFSGELHRKTLQNQNFLHQTLLLFTCSIQIRNPKFKKAHQSTGSERQTAATKNSLLSRLCFVLLLLSSFVLLFLLSVWSTVLDLWMIEWNEKLVRLVLIWCMRMRVWSCELCSMRGIWVSEFLFLHPLLLVSASLFIEMMMNGIDHWIILWTG